MSAPRLPHRSRRPIPLWVWFLIYGIVSIQVATVCGIVSAGHPNSAAGAASVAFGIQAALALFGALIAAMAAA